jgi:non-specific serine/threonine protein kinase
MIGERILHYEITQRLGAGGMGEVFRALDTRLGREVALKFLPAGHQADPQSRARLINEARAASLLRSPNIAVTYDLGEHDGSIFIVMEYVEGELVSTRIARGPLEPRDAVDIAMQVADALDEAHARGIVHRDIKSGNLIITDRGLVKVMDFGLAKFLPEALRTADSTTLQQTSAGVVLGTVYYMSPEQVLGRQVDHRSDLFSLGVVVYEMVTGRVPFEGDSLTAVADRILHENPAPLAKVAPRAPTELEGLVRKALEKDPSFRYQSARDLYLDLRTLLRAIEGGAGLRPVDPRATTILGFGPAAVAAQENAVAVMTFSNITKEAIDDWIGSGIAETVTADLKTVGGLSVISRAQIFDALKNLSRDDTAVLDDRLAIDVGRRVGATWIVGGGYQRLGDMVRITAHFIDVRTSTLVRTVKVDGRISEIFDLQDKIVYELTQGLNLELRGSEIAQIERDETRSVEAYEAYSRGMLSLRTGSRDSLDRAIFLFEKATEHDPSYASAWAALGNAYDLKASFLNLPELAERALRFERRAIEINPRLPDAHRWLGGALMTLGRVDEAIQAHREALLIDPRNAAAHSGLGRTYWLGKGMIQEGIKELATAASLNPNSGYAFLQLANLYILTGQFDRAEAAARDAIALQERYTSGQEGLQIVGAHARLGYVYYRQARYADAVKSYEREMAFLSSSDHALADRTGIELFQKLGAAYLANGDAQQGSRYLDLAIQGFERRVASGAADPFTQYYIGLAYALRGDPDRALHHLEASNAKLAVFNRVRAPQDPDLRSLRDDPRFQALFDAPTAVGSG